MGIKTHVNKMLITLIDKQYQLIYCLLVIVFFNKMGQTHLLLILA